MNGDKGAITKILDYSNPFVIFNLIDFHIS